MPGRRASSSPSATTLRQPGRPRRATSASRARSPRCGRTCASCSSATSTTADERLKGTTTILRQPRAHRRNQEGGLTLLCVAGPRSRDHDRVSFSIPAVRCASVGPQQGVVLGLAACQRLLDRRRGRRRLRAGGGVACPPKMKNGTPWTPTCWACSISRCTSGRLRPSAGNPPLPRGPCRPAPARSASTSRSPMSSPSTKNALNSDSTSASCTPQVQDQRIRRWASSVLGERSMASKAKRNVLLAADLDERGRGLAARPSPNLRVMYSLRS